MTFIRTVCSFIFLAVSSLHAAQLNSSQGQLSPPEVLNQILFYESKQSWTSRDFELFEKVKKELLNKSRISQFTENEAEDYLLSRLSTREAILFEVTAVKFKVTEQEKQTLSGFSAKEVDGELKQLGLAIALVELKESQLKQKLRFKTWFDLLKRKYQVKIKSSDFKP